MIISDIIELDALLPSNVVREPSRLLTLIEQTERSYIIPILGRSLYKSVTDEYKKVMTGEAVDATGEVVVGIQELTATEEGERVEDVQLTDLQELIKLCQIPAVYMALANNTGLLSVSFNSSGMNMVSSDDYDAAKDVDRKAFSTDCYMNAHRGIEQILLFLEELCQRNAESDIVKLWKQSTYFYLQNALFIRSAREFDRMIPIEESRETFIRLIPRIRQAQDSVIRPELGDSLTDALIQFQLFGPKKAEASDDQADQSTDKTQGGTQDGAQGGAQGGGTTSTTEDSESGDSVGEGIGEGVISTQDLEEETATDEEAPKEPLDKHPHKDPIAERPMSDADPTEGDLMLLNSDIAFQADFREYFPVGRHANWTAEERTKYNGWQKVLSWIKWAIAFRVENEDKKLRREESANDFRNQFSQLRKFIEHNNYIFEGIIEDSPLYRPEHKPAGGCPHLIQEDGSHQNCHPHDPHHPESEHHHPGHMGATVENSFTHREPGGVFDPLDFIGGNPKY